MSCLIRNLPFYTFKYAHPEGIVEFGDYHADTMDEKLTECRRCPKKVVQVANALIRNKKDVLLKL